MISTLPGSKFTIYSDSYSALLAIKAYNPQHPVVQDIQEWLFRLSIRYKEVQFCWVPAHVGIQGNELADQEARNVILEKDVEFHHIPSSDMKWCIRSHIRNKWQACWSSPLLANNKKYKEVRDSVKHWPSSFNSNRKVEVVLSRLRIGHTYLTHQYLLEGGNVPVCARCDMTLSVEHILVHCPLYDALRRRLGLGGKPISVLLGDDTDVTKIMQFLKESRLLFKI